MHRHRLSFYPLCVLYAGVNRTWKIEHTLDRYCLPSFDRGRMLSSLCGGISPSVFSPSVSSIVCGPGLEHEIMVMSGGRNDFRFKLERGNDAAGHKRGHEVTS